MSDMSVDIFALYPFGKLALKKMGNDLPENFRLYEAGWVWASMPNQNNVMEVKGAEFRVAKSGVNKGKLSIKVPGTDKKIYLTSDEIKAYETGLE